MLLKLISCNDLLMINLLTVKTTGKAPSAFGNCFYIQVSYMEIYRDTE